MIATASIWDNFIDYLIPIVALIVYLLASMRKKEKHPLEPSMEEKEESMPSSLPFKKQKTSSTPPPIHRRAPSLHSQIENRHVESAIDNRDFSSSINEENPSIVSAGMLKHIDIDPAYADRSQKKASRARKMFKNKSSLKDAFLLQEIIKRPYE
jgi:hypothetical protein